MNTSLSKDELWDLLRDTNDIFAFFKVIKDNNLVPNLNGGIYDSVKGRNGCIFNVGDEFDVGEIMYEFYNYWLKHNSSPTNSLGFIDLRC